MSFQDLGLGESILKAIEEKGYKKPSDIQTQAIPEIIKGHDILATSKTGSGKTASFTLPILEKFSQRKPLRIDGKKPIRALIITPTRELAAQIQDNIKSYSKFTKLNSTVIFGGVSINPQISHLRGGVDILTATPGRLLDLNNQNIVNLSHVETLVLDEADRMLDMGFIKDIRKIISLLPKKRQNLLFSATFAKTTQDLAQSLLKSPKEIKIQSLHQSHDLIKQCAYNVDKKRKPALLKYLIQKGAWKQVLVFTRTKFGANRLSAKLQKFNINSCAIHSNKSQNARQKALESFKKGECRVLVATDIAARGIDIKELPYVINFEIPNVPEDYVHRIGRTGRAEHHGQAISLVCHEEVKFIKAIEKHINTKLQRIEAPGFEVDDSSKHWQESSPKKKQTKHKKKKPSKNSNSLKTQKEITANSKGNQEISKTKKSKKNNYRSQKKKNPLKSQDNKF